MCDCSSYTIEKTGISKICNDCGRITDHSADKMKILSSTFKHSGPNKEMQSILFSHSRINTTTVLCSRTTKLEKELHELNERYVKNYEAVKFYEPALKDTAETFIEEHEKSDTIVRAKNKKKELAAILYVKLIERKNVRLPNEIKRFFEIEDNILQYIISYKSSVKLSEEFEICSIVDSEFEKNNFYFDERLRIPCKALAIITIQKNIITNQTYLTLIFGSIWNVLNRPYTLNDTEYSGLAVSDFLKMTRNTINEITINTYIKHTIELHEKFEPIYKKLKLRTEPYAIC